MQVKKKYVDEIIGVIQAGTDEFWAMRTHYGSKEKVLADTALIERAAKRYQCLIENHNYESDSALTESMKIILPEDSKIFSVNQQYITGLAELYRIPELAESVDEVISDFRSYIGLVDSYIALAQKKIHNELSESNSGYIAELFIGVFQGSTDEVKQQAVETAQEKYPNAQITISDIKLVAVN